MGYKFGVTSSIALYNRLLHLLLQFLRNYYTSFDKNVNTFGVVKHGKYVGKYVANSMPHMLCNVCLVGRFASC